MHFLTAERQSRLRVLLANLAEGQREHEEISRLDAQIRIDYHGRFLIELIQNAIDPSQQAGIDRAKMLIVRTPDHLAVLNQGAPFDERGLKALLSLGLSSKQPDEAIGNKGVGFKSVFEVAETAEVFGVQDQARSLATLPGLRLALSRAPASEHPGLVEEAVTVAEAAGLVDLVEQRTGATFAAALTDALSLTAGWRFPIERSAKEWAERCTALGLSEEDLQSFTTAVVLHLIPGQQTIVDRALAELTEAADEVHLFLPGLERLELRTGDQTFILLREERVASGPEGVAVRRLTTIDNGEVIRETDYWVMSTLVDGPEVAATASRLPGAGWASVTRAQVQVALPIGVGGAAPEADGRCFVGLPTKDATGSPFRIDARFHATLSRTALDRVDNSYNRLLDQAAADLAAKLLLRLRDAPQTASFLLDEERARRMVLYGLVAHGRGSFGEAVRRGVAGEVVVLDRSGACFLAPGAAHRLVEPDRELVELVVRRLGLRVVQERGISLVDKELEREAGEVLLALGCSAVKPGDLLQKAEGGSLLEGLARVLPREEASEWGVLLRWVLDRASGQVADQRFLPVTGGALMTPQDSPFLPLALNPVRGELGIADVPHELLSDLLFVDGAVLGEDSDLRRRLVEGAQPLCRSATAADLLEHALLPALARLVEGGEGERALEVLALGLRLLAKVPADEGVDGFPWLVPCVEDWKPADDAYLGDLWSRVERKPDAPPGLVEAVYGPEGRCLRAWWGSEEELDASRSALLRAGVAEAPRDFLWNPIKQVFWGDYHRGEIRQPEPPDPVLAAIWQPWLTHIAQVAAVDWGPQTWWHIQDMQWIDGLERPEAAQRIAAWVLTVKHSSASLLPEPDTSPRAWRRHKSPGEVLQPWAFALQRLDFPYVPTKSTCIYKGALALPIDLCRVPHGARVPSWLPQAASGLDEGTLKLIGVRSLNEMPSDWLLSQLDVFARGLSGANGEVTVARGLWTLLATKANKGDLPVLGAGLLPVWRDGALVAMPGNEIEHLVLIDDPYAAEVLGARLDGVCLLEQGDEAWPGLLLHLRRAMPSARVEAVSEIELPYAPHPTAPVGDVPTYLRAQLGARLLAILAAVIHRSGIAQKEMHRCWQALQTAKLQIGVLGPQDPAAVWLAGKRLLLSQPLPPAALVAELWPIVGPRWRNDLLALGHALARGDRGLRDHLRHQHIGDEALSNAAAFFKLTDWEATIEIPAQKPASPQSVPLRPVIVDLRDGEGAEEEDDLDPPYDTHTLTQSVVLAPLPSTLPRPSASPVTGTPAQTTQPARSGRTSNPSTGSHGNEAYAREIGHHGEWFAFRVLQARLPDFNEACWVSSSRELLGLAAGDDTLGYDFVYVDQSGQLGGRPGATCFIEVKANAGAMRQRFSVSSNEWRLATECSHSEDRVFVILRVHDVAGQPQVGAILLDPVGMVATGGLRLAPRDGWWVDVANADGAPGTS